MKERELNRARAGSSWKYVAVPYAVSAGAGFFSSFNDAELMQ